MKYVIHSVMANDMASFGMRFENYRILYRTCRGITWTLLPFAYLGALLATTAAIQFPFQFLHWLRVAPPSIAFWTTAGVTAAGMLWLLGRCVWLVIRSIRRGIVHVEAIVVILGVLVGAWYVVHVFSRGGDF
jgi:hypothetical protein